VPSNDVPLPVVDEKYVLAVGAITPRKGFEILAAAMNFLPDDVVLVIAGPDGWDARRVKRVIRGAAGERLRLLGHVGDRVLESLYRNATVICVPSLAEGFGLPCLEGMTYGCAVAASDIPCIREVGGDCVALCTPGDEHVLGTVIRGLLEDETGRASMGRRARQRAATYSWPRAVDRVVNVYRAVCP
jgi:glycosyltransferase involved in cell wall biosynthesis